MTSTNLQPRGRRRLIVSMTLALALAGLLASTALAVQPGSGGTLSPVNLGKAGTFVVLSKSGITNVPTSRITGDMGVSPISYTAITGFALSPIVPVATTVYSTSAQVTGKIYAANYASPTPANLTTAVLNMEAAYSDAAGRKIDPERAEDDRQRGQTVGPGVVAICDQCRRPDFLPDPDPIQGDELVAGKPDDACEGQESEFGDRLGVEQAIDRLPGGQGRRRCDHRQDEQAGQVLPKRDRHPMVHHRGRRLARGWRGHRARSRHDDPGTSVGGGPDAVDPGSPGGRPGRLSPMSSTDDTAPAIRASIGRPSPA